MPNQGKSIYRTWGCEESCRGRKCRLPSSSSHAAAAPLPLTLEFGLLGQSSSGGSPTLEGSALGGGGPVVAMGCGLWRSSRAVRCHQPRAAADNWWVVEEAEAPW